MGMRCKPLDRFRPLQLQVAPIAYLYLGRVSHFCNRHDLEVAGWRPRLSLDSPIHFDRREGEAGTDHESLLVAVRHAVATVQDKKA